MGVQTQGIPEYYQSSAVWVCTGVIPYTPPVHPHPTGGYLPVLSRVEHLEYLQGNIPVSPPYTPPYLPVVRASGWLCVHTHRTVSLVPPPLPPHSQPLTGTGRGCLGVLPYSSGPLVRFGEYIL